MCCGCCKLLGQIWKHTPCCIKCLLQFGGCVLLISIVSVIVGAVLLALYDSEDESQRSLMIAGAVMVSIGCLLILLSIAGLVVMYRKMEELRKKRRGQANGTYVMPPIKLVPGSYPVQPQALPPQETAEAQAVTTDLIYPPPTLYVTDKPIPPAPKYRNQAPAPPTGTGEHNSGYEAGVTASVPVMADTMDDEQVGEASSVAAQHTYTSGYDNVTFEHEDEGAAPSSELEKHDSFKDPPTRLYRTEL
ncbi:PREDICTED: uncharacterized protein LOC106812276 [Priapulus caudatus]|uniref:Uncharacterized protein LOC106812276 n=1 Tax=Priapulus caudatus TaxID=37621 RepID=A0ABM1EHC3_PRICU|nr:PREDICTED: uncharacterized protein LOC106812276 [Priapulus caudatus]